MAKLITFEGVVDQGVIRLDSGVRLPDRTKVYVVVPNAGDRSVARVLSPRLAHPEQAAVFAMEVAPVDGST